MGSQQLFRIVLDQEVHVGTGLLLRRIVFEFAQKGAGVRGVDDGQPAGQVRQLVGKVPGHGAAPVVGHQAFQRLCAAGFNGDQGRNVLHQMLGSVGADILRGG